MNRFRRISDKQKNNKKKQQELDSLLNDGESLGEVTSMFSNLKPRIQQQHQQRKTGGADISTIKLQPQGPVPLPLKDPPTSQSPSPHQQEQEQQEHFMSKDQPPPTSSSSSSPGQQQLQHRTTTPLLYPSLDAVKGHSIRHIYPSLLNDSDEDDDEGESGGRHEEYNSKSNPGTAAPVLAAGMSLSTTTPPRPASSAPMTVVPSNNLSSSSSSSSSLSLPAAPVENHADAAAIASTMSRLLTSPATSTTDSGSSSSSLSCFYNHSHRGGATSTASQQQKLQQQKQTTKGCNPSSAVPFSFGRPSNRRADLEDDIPQPLKPASGVPRAATSGAKNNASSLLQNNTNNSKPFLSSASSWTQMTAAAAAQPPRLPSNGSTIPSEATVIGVGKPAITMDRPLVSDETNDGGDGKLVRAMILQTHTSIADVQRIRRHSENPILMDDTVKQGLYKYVDEDDDDDGDDDGSNDSDLRRALRESEQLAIAEAESANYHRNCTKSLAGNAQNDGVIITEGRVSSQDEGHGGGGGGGGGGGAPSSMTQLSPGQREAIQSNASTLRSVCEQPRVDPEVIQFCLLQCQQDQTTLSQVISLADNDQDLNDLLQLNETVLTVLDIAKEKQEKQQAQGPSVGINNDHNNNNTSNIAEYATTASSAQQQISDFRRESSSNSNINHRNNSNDNDSYHPDNMGMEQLTSVASASSNRLFHQAESFSAHVPSPPNPAISRQVTSNSSSMEIGNLVRKQDIFSLICMLRSQAHHQRFDAALALMQFARNRNNDSYQLRNEIHSSGGLHSLLTLFFKTTVYSLQLISGLAVAYVLPAAAQTNHNVPIKPQVGLKVTECLQFLSGVTADTSVKGNLITQKECLTAAASGLTTFWVHALEPMLRLFSANNKSASSRNLLVAMEQQARPIALESRITLSGRTAARSHHHHQRGTMMVRDQHQQAAGVHELLEIAVTLAIRFASCTSDTDGNSPFDPNYTADIVLLVEQVCATEEAQPIAVREGILKVLVDWIRRKPKGSSGGSRMSGNRRATSEQNPSQKEDQWFKLRSSAILSLRHLTTIKDQYMAGWIHSQMLSSGALPAIVALTRPDMHLILSYPVRLAIAQVIATLCIAPHTRAAVVEADCVHFLIDLLYDGGSPATSTSSSSTSLDSNQDEVVLYAGQALLQLASGAMQRAGMSYGDGGKNHEKDLLLKLTSRQRHDRILNDMVARGAIGSFVNIALQKRGKLRMVAIETLGVLSEDVNPIRGTRLQLCEDGAARALGETLTDCLSRVNSNDSGKDDPPPDLTNEDWEQLYRALCALSNILDPTYEGAFLRSASHHGPSELMRPHSLLTKSCLQTIESGGLQSMLQLATFPLNETRVIQLVEESCHSLSLLSPFLLSKDIASNGLAGWADQVLDVFCDIVDALEKKYALSSSNNDAEQDFFGQYMDLHVSVLQGIAALAKSAPLKVRIVDRVLPYLIRAKNSRDCTNVSNSASQAFQSLEFADDEVAIQTAGNNASLLADWFCLQRSFVIQAMARAEIRQSLCDLWGEALTHANEPAPALTKFARSLSSGSRASSVGSSTGLMDQLVGGSDGDLPCESTLKEYIDMFGEKSSLPNTMKRSFLAASPQADSGSTGLLSQQVYPLNGSQQETLWILDHAKLVADGHVGGKSCGTGGSFSDRVERLLQQCFPSRLLRERVISTQILNLESTYNFRAILMPQRRYFSFRREGLLLSRLCDKESSNLPDNPGEVHWTLNFTNSSFAGEFPESLVQSLYLCPTICALSFAGSNSRKQADSTDAGGKNESSGPISARTKAPESGGGLVANLVGSLPPWVSNLTFEKVLDEEGMKALVTILETIGRLTAGSRSFLSQTKGDTAQAQGRFSFFAVRDSPDLRGETWQSFFSLMGHNMASSPSGVPRDKRPLSRLRYLDVSWNKLGDELCANLLAIIHDRGSECNIEELDLTGNSIGEGIHVLEVLQWYSQMHRSHKLSGGVTASIRGAAQWRAPLHTLILSSNDLWKGKTWLEIIALLKNNTLELKSLDLSCNKLMLKEDDYDSDILVSSLLKNTSLRNLNLSGNKFSSGTINEILGQLENVCIAGASDSKKGLSLIDLSKNTPSLSEHQERRLEALNKTSRSAILQRFHAEKDAKLDKEYANSTSTAGLEYNKIDEIVVEEQKPLSFLPGPLRFSRAPTASIRADGSETENADSGPGVPDNKITVLFSAPLVFKDGSENLRPFAKLDFEMERELLWQCLKEASRDIELSFDSATHDRLLATISKRCSCLHYSGHGNEHYLPFEDGTGGPNWFEVEDIKRLIGARRQGEDVPFRFVFVSACYSGLAGETFAAAGVPHVVCCRQEFELKDAAALAFTRQFYLALAVGHTVKDSFELGCKAVRATPNLRDAEKEMDKFILLPREGNHDVPIFNAEPILHWPRPLAEGSSSFKAPAVSAGARSKSIRNLGNARSSELSVRNMIQEDPSPSPSQFFLGREVDTYIVMNLLLVKRLVSVIGDVGVGRSSLVCALCHYINERKSTMSQTINHIYYIKAKQGRAKQNRVKSLVQRLVKKLIDADVITAEDVDKNADIEGLFDIICSSLKNEKALIVVDRTELLEDSDEANEFPMLLSNLFRETRQVRVLLTARVTLGIPSIGGHVEHYYRLGPLTFANSVRLFSSLCPFLHTPSDRRRLYQKMVLSQEEAELLPTDPGISAQFRQKFQLIGNGVPSMIEKAAYTISKEDFMSLLRGGTNSDHESDHE